MNKSIEFRGMDHLADLEGRVNDQLVKVERLLEKQREPAAIQVIITKYPTHAHNEVTVHLTVTYNDAPGSHRIMCHKEGHDLNVVVDDAINCAYRELLNYKAKLIDDRRKTPKHQDVE